MFESINGRAVGWAELKGTINVAGGIALPTLDVKSITHESTVERGEKRGAGGGNVRGRTTGQLSNTASATFYRDGFRSLKKALAAAAALSGAVNLDGHVQLSKVTFDYVVTHDWVDDPEIYCIKLLGCHLDKESGKHEEGTDPETVDVDLNPLRIVEIVDGIETVLL